METMQFKKAPEVVEKETCAFYIDAVVKRALERKSKELGHPQSKLVNDIFHHVLKSDVEKINRSSKK